MAKLLIALALLLPFAAADPAPQCGTPPVKDLCINAHILARIPGMDYGDCCCACMLDRGCNGFVSREYANGTVMCMLHGGDLSSNNSHFESGCTGAYLRGQNIPPPTLPPQPPISKAPSNALNVLFIAVDDFRPNIGAYNFSLVHTPNLDHLAATGLRFDQAYVQYAYCAPSRNSFMSGRRPDTTQVWNFINHFREPAIGAAWQSMPEYFKQHGYLTLGGGKLFHPDVPPLNDFPQSWTPEYPYFDNQPKNDPYTCAEAWPPHSPTYCEAEVDKDDSKLTDQKIRDNCLEHLKLAGSKQEDQPFFVGCGFHKPHVPWVVPKEFYDMIPAADDVPLAADQYAPIGMPEVAWHWPADVHGIDITFNGTIPPNISHHYRRAYYAAISYQDYIIGQVLSELEELHLDNNTVVMFFGDHGWQLGEHDTYAKMTNFELATHIPLIVRAPHKTNSTGKSTSVLAEAVDFYPTLAELAGLPDPKSEGQNINGTSLVPIFDNPDYADFKPAAYSQFGKISNFSVENHFLRNQTNIMGYTVRVPDWRYTCWFGWDHTEVKINQSDVLGRELYDHHEDTGLWLDFPGENINVVDRPEHESIVNQLHAMVMEYIQLK
eukprot:TRINITY_DN12321_c0_g4_i3.p1 TRINITY_DN12321_c0_g4~~TRINITY_DN12321_c0_g4_i3.p1  ORF type:complete len:605 (+),score=134.73 TRINITY_DN12321_c0_g4_i3:2-1816(+)